MIYGNKCSIWQNELGYWFVKCDFGAQVLKTDCAHSRELAIEEFKQIHSLRKTENPRRLKREGLRGPIPPGAIYVGRPSQWGNPFRIGPDGTRKEVLAKYEQWLLRQEKLFFSLRAELGGRNLVCHCLLDLPCHADILLRYANHKVTSYENKNYASEIASSASPAGPT
jgi:hypothetical protein